MLFILASFALAVDSDWAKYCICDVDFECPAECSVDAKIIKFDAITDLNPYFYGAPEKTIIGFTKTNHKYTFEMSLFTSKEAKFYSFDEFDPVTLHIGFYGNTPKFTNDTIAHFENVKVNFTNLEEPSSIKENVLFYKLLTVNKTELTFYPQDKANSIKAQGLACQVSLLKQFNDVTIYGGVYPDFQLELDYTEREYVNFTLNKMELYVSHNDQPGVHVHFYSDSGTDNDVDIYGRPGSPGKCYFRIAEGVEMKDAPKIFLHDVFETYIEGKWPDQTPYIFMDNDELNPGHISTVYANSEILPFTAECYTLYLILGKSNVKICGRIQSNVTLTVNSEVAADRVKVNFNDMIDGNVIIQHGNIDVVCNKLKIDNAITQDFPVIFGVSEKGIATFTMNTFDGPKVFYKNLIFYNNLREYQPDSKLAGLIKSHKIFESPIFNTISESIKILFSSTGGYIPSFRNESNCFTYKVDRANDLFDITITVQPPSELPLVLCYETVTCDNGQFVNESQLANLQKEFFPGQKTLHIEVGKAISNIVLSNLGKTTEKCTVEIVDVKGHNSVGINLGTESVHSVIDTLSLKKVTLSSPLTVNTANLIMEELDTSSHITTDKDVSITCDADSLNIIKDLQCNDLTVNAFVDLNKVSLNNDGWTFSYQSSITPVKILSFNLAGNLIINGYQPIAFECADSTAKGFTFDIKNSLTISLENSWTAKLSPPISVKQNSFRTKVYLSEPSISDDIHFDTQGAAIQYIANYSKTTTICASSTGSSSSCPQGSDQCTISALEQKIMGTDFNNLKVYITETTVSNYPTISSSYLDSKMFEFIGLNSKQVIHIKQDTPIKAPKFAQTTFQNIDLQAEAPSVPFQFGDLRLIETDIIGLTQTEAYIDDINCTYNDLVFFKQITIKDSATIYGQIEKTNVATVYFDTDQDDEDLTLHIPDGTEIRLGDNKKVIVGSTTFSFKGYTPDYDLVLLPEKGAKLQIIYDATSYKTFPHAYVRDSLDCHITLKNFPEQSANTVYINFTTFENSTLYIDSVGLPICLWQPEDYTIMIGAQTVSIAGIVRNVNRDETPPIIDVDTSKVSGECTITLMAGLNVPSINYENLHLFQLLKPKLTLVIQEITIDQKDGHTNFGFFHYIDLTGHSQVKVLTPLAKGDFYNEFFIRNSMDGELTEAQLNEFCSKNYSLLVAHEQDLRTLTNIKVYYQGLTMTTSHGFSNLHNAFGLIYDEPGSTLGAVPSIDFYPIVNPMYLPYILGFGYNGDEVEAFIDINDLADVSKKIPAAQKALEIHIESENNKNQPLKFDISRFVDMHITLVGQRDYQHTVPRDLYVTLGNVNSLNNLTLDFVKMINPSTTYTFYLDILKCIESEIETDKISVHDVGIIEMDSFTYNKLKTKIGAYNGDFVLTTLAPIIIFELMGWTIRDQYLEVDLNANNFPNIRVKCQNDLVLQISDDIKGDTVCSIDLEVDPKPGSEEFVIQVAKRWNEIRIPSVMYISTNFTGTVIFDTESFPFPFEVLGNEETTRFAADAGPFIYPRDYTFKDQSKILNFTTITDETHRYLYAKNALFSGNTSIKFVEDKGHLLAEEAITFANDSISEVRNLNISNDAKLIAQQNVLLTGICRFEKTSIIELHWRLNHIPKLLFDEEPEGEVPQAIKIIFDDESIIGQEDEYNLLLYKSLFKIINVRQKCRQWAEKLEFISTVRVFSYDNIFVSDCENGALTIMANETIPKQTPTATPTASKSGETPAPTRSKSPQTPTASASRSSIPTKSISPSRSNSYSRTPTQSSIPPITIQPITRTQDPYTVGPDSKVTSIPIKPAAVAGGVLGVLIVFAIFGLLIAIAIKKRSPGSFLSPIKLNSKPDQQSYVDDLI